MLLHPIFEGAKGVIFDKDGTLLDHDATWIEPTKQFALRASNGNTALAKRLLSHEKFDWDTNTFSGGDGIAGNTWPVSARRMAQNLDAWGESTQHVQPALEWILGYQAQAVPLPGVDALLKALKNTGVKIGLATNDVERNARHHMAQLGLETLFDAFVGSDSGFGGKPEPGIIQGCAHRLGLSASQCIMVGDTDRDTLAGSAAGCLQVIATLNGNPLSDSIKASATLVLDETQSLCFAP